MQCGEPSYNLQHQIFQQGVSSVMEDRSKFVYDNDSMLDSFVSSTCILKFTRGRFLQY